MSAYVWQAAESRRTAAQRRQREREEQERRAGDLVESLNVDVEPLPLAVLDGEVEDRLVVPAGCQGIIIGKGGENLKKLRERFKVKVDLEGKSKKGEDEHDSELTIRGKLRDVQAARAELDFASEKVDVPLEVRGWMIGEGGRHLKQIKELSGAVVLKVVDGVDEIGSAAAWVDVKGRREAVESARLCLECHLSYHPVFVEMEQVERELDHKIAQAKAGIGRRAVAVSKPTNGAGGAGDGGRRHASGGVGAETGEALVEAAAQDRLATVPDYGCFADADQGPPGPRARGTDKRNVGPGASRGGKGGRGRDGRGRGGGTGSKSYGPKGGGRKGEESSGRARKGGRGLGDHGASFTPGD